MHRSFAMMLLLAALPAVALADRLVLVDGRTFSGTVRVEADTVIIEMTYGTLRFTKDQVARIEMKDTPDVELAKKLSEARKNDAAALFTIAQWAATNDLKRQAGELYARVLEIDPNHAGARRELGFVAIEGQWQTFDKGLELARGKLEADKLESLLKDVLPALEAGATAPQQAVAVRELIGQTQVRAKDFAPAAKTFTELADKSEGAAAVRFGAIAAILKDNPDGMYVVTEPYPPAADLLGNTKDALKPGPASLAQPNVLRAALRDRAKKDIEAGRKLMDAAVKLDATDPDGAKAKYFQASQAFDRADALVADISRSYRIEVVRRRIAALRKDADTDAEKFDQGVAELGRKNATPQQYKDMILRMIHSLDNVRSDLQTILALAKPYPRDLVLEITLAETNLKKIETMRRILTDELNGQK